MNIIQEYFKYCKIISAHRDSTFSSLLFPYNINELIKKADTNCELNYFKLTVFNKDMSKCYNYPVYVSITSDNDDTVEIEIFSKFKSPNFEVYGFMLTDYKNLHPVYFNCDPCYISINERTSVAKINCTFYINKTMKEGGYYDSDLRVLNYYLNKEDEKC